MLNNISEMISFVLDRNGKKCNFEPEYIYNALRRETLLNGEQAKFITLETTRLVYVVSDKVKYFTSPMIREFVNCKLIEYGFEADRLKHTRIGIPKYDLDCLLPKNIFPISDIPNYIKIKIADHVIKENKDVNKLYNKIQANGNKEIKKPSIKSIPQ